MNVIQDLGGAPAAAPQAASLPSLDSNAPAIPSGPLKVLRGVANGQIPGVVVPKGSPEIASDLTPDDLSGMGVGFYIPQSTDYVGVLFNPEQISEGMLQKMDKAGKLSELPSIDSMLGESPAAEPVTPEEGAAPSGMGAVPIMPRPSMSADAQGELANDRLQNLTTEPSKRKLPGAGTVLNGLMNRAI